MTTLPNIGRSTEEWVGRTPDSKPPPHVRLRVFERHHGICHIAKRKIRTGEPWDCDHVIALADWTGEGHGNRESNLAPALKDKHLTKTVTENRERADVRRVKSKAIGIKKRRTITAWRRFDGTPVYAGKDR